MTTIHPETQVVASAYDPLTRVCSYTYQHHDGSRYTVNVPLDELMPHRRQGRPQARAHLARKIINHIQTNPPDDVGK